MLDLSLTLRTLTKTALALTLILVVGAAAAQPRPGDILQLTPTGIVTASEIERLGPPLFEGFGTPNAHYDVATYRVVYRSTDFDGSPADIVAQLFVPVFAVPSERPVYAFGSGTTGIANVCAPSLEQPEVRRWGHYRTNMLAYAAKGFIAIFPDYLGFHDETRPQRYFSKQAEAHTMLDAIRAVYRFFDEHGERYAVRPSDKVFTAGYSQGGHAALAAADLRERYAPEVPLTGAIGYGQTNDVLTLLKEGPYYAPYIIYTYAQMYGYNEINPSALLQERWARSLTTDVNRLCVDQFQVYYPFDGSQLYTPAFYDALYNERLAEAFPAFYSRLRENASGLSGHGLPVLVVQGNQDIIITTPSQTRFVKALCEAGSLVEYHRLDGVRHRHTRPAGFGATVSFMERLAAGEAPVDHCGGL
jgi:acetyl esterase/lipase